MSKYIVIPIVLLLIRSLQPAVDGLNLAVKRPHNENTGSKVYGQESLEEEAFQPNPVNMYWTSHSNSAKQNSPNCKNRQLVDVPLLRNLGFTTEQISTNMDLFTDDKLFLSSRKLPFSRLPADVSHYPKNKLVPYTKMDQHKREEYNAIQTGEKRPKDYLFDNRFVQLVKLTLEKYGLESTVKLKIKPSPAKTNSAHYFMEIPNEKKDQDEYICHFKLCQVGISGIRLSDAV